GRSGAGLPASSLACSGCGWAAPAGAPLPLSCPASRPGDDIDHVIVRRLGPAAGPFPAAAGTDDAAPANPYVQYRRLFHAWHVARGIGWNDAEYVALVERLDAAVARVDGHGFRVTPFGRSDALSDRLGFSARGGVWVKDETGNVSGSHKARHLFGTLLELEVEAAHAAQHAATEAAGQPPFAIASCGNAALAAGVVARAAGRTLDVFVPTDAPPPVVARLRDLGARITVCERDPGLPGDPTVHALHRALAAGAIPFTCQGNLNGLAIEGGETLGWEIASTIGRPGGPARLDRLVVQVGGGALASSAIAAFEDARVLGLPIGLPRLDTVQTRGAFPLARAFERVRERLGAGESIEAAVAFAARHRAAFMWPWEEPPHSIAHGILDDETYDWQAVVRGMLAAGGSAVVVDEADLEEANALARESTGIDVDHTGSSGLAGLLALVRAGEVRPDENVAVLFTGVVRRPDDGASWAGGTAARAVAPAEAARRSDGEAPAASN
ncbi:MAG: Pyridoxal-5'-phosphate-dependent enzyme, beta subunit, partial [Chloroflexi bacterium]|nr:Pyridoxal-5'-phosphate-dependent enzyme, beta subunit [Chloroflexota bacterium]